MKIWITDPTTKQPSVSLTILMVTFLGALVAASLNLAKITDHTSTSTELFYSACCLYFGRRFSFGGKSYDGGQASTVVATVSKLESETTISGQ